MLESGYLIEYSGMTYIQLDLVWRFFLVLLLGLALIHAASLAAVVLCKFAARKYSDL